MHSNLVWTFVLEMLLYPVGLLRSERAPLVPFVSTITGDGVLDNRGACNPLTSAVLLWPFCTVVNLKSNFTVRCLSDHTATLKVVNNF